MSAVQPQRISLAKLRWMLFLGTGVPVGVVMGVMSLPGLATGVLLGAFFGGLMALIVGCWQRTWPRRRVEGGVLWVRQSATVVSSRTAVEAVTTARNAMRTLRCSGIRQHSGSPIVLAAHTRMSWRSFGEVVRVRVSEQALDGSSIRVSSVPRWPLTLADYGKNFENVQRVVAAFDDSANATTVVPS